MGGMDSQHGSAEQQAPGHQGTQGNYFDYMGGDTPRTSPRSNSPRRIPRSPRARSMGPSAEQEEEAYESRRDERRESRHGVGGDPVGVTFRLNACEQSLRSHNDEMAAQRLMLQQLADAVTKLNS